MGSNNFLTGDRESFLIQIIRKQKIKIKNLFGAIHFPRILRHNILILIILNTHHEFSSTDRSFFEILLPKPFPPPRLLKILLFKIFHVLNAQMLFQITTYVSVVRQSLKKICLKYRGIREKCHLSCLLNYIHMYTIYLSICTQTAETTSSQRIRIRIPLHIYDRVWAGELKKEDFI